MAFCAISNNDLKNLYLIVNVKLNADPLKINNMSGLAKEVFDFAVSKGLSVEKAINLVSYLPQSVLDYVANKANREKIRNIEKAKGVKISTDLVRELEETHFEDYNKLATFLDIKTEQPIIIVSNPQVEAAKKVDDLTKSMKIEFIDVHDSVQNKVVTKRKINGKLYEVRVTEVATAGFNESFTDNTDHPALKHGNTIDAIAKKIFDGTLASNEKFEGIADPALESAVGRLFKMKKELEDRGFIFRTGVVVYDEVTGMSGEIDLLGIDKDGNYHILDFKTGQERFTKEYLKKDKITLTSVNQEVGILSKWNQYATQGILYGMMLNKLTNVPVDPSMTILGITLKYDATVPSAQSAIEKVADNAIIRIPSTEIRKEYKGKSLSEILEVYNKIKSEDLGTIKQATETKKSRRKFDLNRGPNQRQELNRIARIDEIAATDTELQKEIEWLRSVFGPDVLLNLDDMVNSGLFGQFTLDGITLYKNASKGTGYHEGWHRFSQVFMNPTQKTRLYDSVRKDAIDFTTRDGRKLNTSTAQLIDIEEFLAEEFAKYGLNPESYSYPKGNPEPKNLFQKIWNYLLRFFGVNPRPVTLFQKLYRGKISKYRTSGNNAFWGTLNSIAVNSAGVEIVRADRFPLYKSTFQYLIGKELSDFGKSFTALKQSKSLQKQVFENVFFAIKQKMLAEGDKLTDEQWEELGSIHENMHEFTNIFLKHTDYDTLKGTEIDEDVFTKSAEEIAALEDLSDVYADVLELEDDDKPSSSEKYGERGGNENSALLLANKEIHDFFRSIPKIKEVIKTPEGETVVYELNELGYPENHKYYDIFYKTKKLLSGKFEMQDILDALNNKDNQRIFPELKIVAEYIQSFLNNKQEKNYYRRIQNVTFIQSFVNAMITPEISNTQLTLNYTALQNKTKQNSLKTTTVSYRKAFRNMSLNIIKSWEKDFKDRRNKDFVAYRDMDTKKNGVFNSPLYLTDDGKLLLNPFINYRNRFNYRNLDSLRNFYELLGVKLNKKVYEDPKAVQKLKDVYNIIVDNIALYGIVKEYDLIEIFKQAAALQGIDVSKAVTLDDYAKILPKEILEVGITSVYLDNPIRDFSEVREFTIDKGKKEKTTAIKFILEEIAEIEEFYGDKVSSGSFRIEDKTKFPYYVPNQISIVTEAVNKLKSIAEFDDNIYLSHINPNKAPWMKHSLFMKRMFQSGIRKMDEGTQNPVKIILEDIASIKIITPENIIEKSPRSLNKDEKFFMDVLTLFHSGAIEIPRAETSSTMFSVRLSSYGKGAVLPLTYNVFANTKDKVPEDFFTVLKDYLLAEVEKRKWYMENESNVPMENESNVPFAKKFNVFEDILSEPLKDKLVEVIDSEDILSQPFSGDTTISQQFRKEVDKYFSELSDSIEAKLKAMGSEQKDLLRDVLGNPNISYWGTAAKAFVVNQFILSTEFYNMFFGDLYFYSNPFKRGKIVTNTGNAMYVDAHRNEMLNDIMGETLNSIYTGVRKPKDFRFIKSAVISDVKMHSSYINNNDAENHMLQDLISIRMQSGRLDPASPTYVEDINKLREQTFKYKNINIADGQGIIGLDFYKNFCLIAAPQLWTEDKENEYQRQKAIFRYKFGLYFKMVNGERVSLTGQELEDARSADEKMVKHQPFSYFNPLKISYTGPAVKEGPFKPVFDKFSVRPIIPEVAIGRRDEALLLKMVEQDADYIKFESGSKVHQKSDNKFDWFKKLGDGQYDLNNHSVEFEADQTLYSAYLKHQLNTEEIKEENILGSQFRKIAFGVRYLSHVKNNPELSKHFAKLENRFKTTIEDLIAIEESDLFSLLGVQKKADGSYYVGDMKRFMKLLNEESTKRGIPVNNINYIQYDENTGQPKYEIDYAFNRAQISDLLSGLIDERLRRLKVNGSAFIQVSMAGFELKSHSFQNPTREQIEQYGTSGLHYYHLKYNEKGEATETSTMGVKIALRGEFMKLLKLPAPKSLGMDKKGNTGTIGIGKKEHGNFDYEESLKRLNLAMQDEEWKEKHRDSFIMVGYRIPTQNNNFIDRMEIMEFLPESAGGIIIPPIELIIKSGSDFDIDKMNIIKPSYTGSGKVVKAPEETIEEILSEIKKSVYEERDIKTAKKDLKDLLNKTDLRITDLFKLQKKVRRTMIDLGMKGGLSDNLIDLMIESAKQHKDTIIPEFEGKPMEEDVFPDEVSYPDDDRAVLDSMIQYGMLDREIENLKNRYEKVEELKEEADEDYVWFEKKKQYKNFKNNELLSTISELLSSPYYYELLVTPSTAEDLQSLANDMIAAKENMSIEEKVQKMKDTGDKLYDTVKNPAVYMQYDTILEVFDNFLGKRKDLGGYAIQRTFADIFNNIRFTIAKEYTVNKKGDRKVIFTPLFSSERKEQLVNNGRIRMHGEFTKDWFDQFISATVDLAGAPFYPHLGINVYNKKHLQYLIHQQVDAKEAAFLLNQPILVELYELVDRKRQTVQGYTLKHGITELALQYKAMENPQRENSKRRKYEVYEQKYVEPVRNSETGEIEESGRWETIANRANPFLSRPYYDLNNNLSENDYFSTSELEQAIREGYHPKRNNSELQKKVLSYFASMIEEADMLMKLQFAYNTDTTKYSTVTSIIKNRGNKRDVKDSDLFSLEEIERIEKETMISPFDYTAKAFEIYQALFPKLYNDVTLHTFNLLADDVWGATNIQLEKISKIIENDYIEYIYKNFGLYNGKNLTDAFHDLIYNTDFSSEHEFFSTKFNQIVGDYPELTKIPFVAGLTEDTYMPRIDRIVDNSFMEMDNMEIRNLYFLRNPDNPTFERDIYTRNWHNLINFDPNKLGLNGQYNQEDVRKISQFFTDLVYFSLYQSGLTNNSNGFSDLIPYEYWGNFIQDAFKRFKEASEVNQHLPFQMMKVFEQRVKQMNPKINFRTKYTLEDIINDKGEKIGEKKIPLPMFKNYYRGKYYKVTDDELGFVSKLFSAEELEDDKQVKAPEKKPSEINLETGRYVKYGNEVYMVLRLMKDGKWQIYNPTIEGPKGKVIVHERNLTAMKDKGKIVEVGARDYIVTAKDEIIDMKTLRRLKVPKDSPLRKQILEAKPKDGSSDGPPKVC